MRRHPMNISLPENLKGFVDSQVQKPLRQSPRDQGVAPAGPEVRAEPHRALDAGK
jgi:hypothetical protein